MSDNPLEHDDEFQLSLRNPNPSFKALKSGDVYRVDFELSKEEWEYFTDPNIDRTGMVIEMVCRVTHRAPKPSVGEISHVPATTLAGDTEYSQFKGGKWSIQAGIMCGNPKFQEFLSIKYWGVWSQLCGGGPEIPNISDVTAKTIKEILGIFSRKELDTDIGARKRFMDLMSHFNRWTEGKDGPD